MSLTDPCVPAVRTFPTSGAAGYYDRRGRHPKVAITITEELLAAVNASRKTRGASFADEVRRLLALALEMEASPKSEPILSPTKRRIYDALRRRPMTAEELRHVVGRFDIRRDDPLDDRTIYAHLCGLRKLLKTHGMTIRRTQRLGAYRLVRL